MRIARGELDIGTERNRRHEVPFSRSENHEQINLYPTECNICGAEVIYTSNAEIYGKKYGSGMCYLCTNADCNSYVGTHISRPKEAFGILADKDMRKGKMLCREIFDSKWMGRAGAKKKRVQMYRWLARQLEIPVSLCHFGYFDIDTLRRAYRILVQIRDVPLRYDKKGKILNEVEKY